MDIGHSMNVQFTSFKNGMPYFLAIGNNLMLDISRKTEHRLLNGQVIPAPSPSPSVYPLQ